MTAIYGKKKVALVKGRRMSYVEHGTGSPEQREYLFALWDQLQLDRDIILVLHDWGSTLGFDWARKHPDQIARDRGGVR
jgi:pimeloyl-ACP methyl ester carboxylesterase